MAIGGGKYHKQLMDLKRETEAEAVFLIVINGNQGHGISAAADLDIAKTIPDVLERVAQEMREENEELDEDDDAA